MRQSTGGSGAQSDEEVVMKAGAEAADQSDKGSSRSLGPLGGKRKAAVAFLCCNGSGGRQAGCASPFHSSAGSSISLPPSASNSVARS